MTDEEIQKLKEDNADLKQSLDWANERESEDCKHIAELEQEKCELLGIIQGKDKVLKELEEQISVLLSCKNCPENKGGYICKKEYENKCLSQKIQYIKELKDDNKVMSELVEKRNDKYFISNTEVLPCIFKPFIGLNKHECVDGYRTKEKQQDILKGETYLFYKSGLNFCWTEDMIIEYTL